MDARLLPKSGFQGTAISADGLKQPRDMRPAGAFMQPRKNAAAAGAPNLSDRDGPTRS